MSAGFLLVDQLRFMAAHHGDEPAYRDLATDRAVTFSEWDTDSNRVARGLQRLGVAKGDRVSIYLPNEEVLRWIVVYAAVHKAGAVAVPTNTRLSEHELVNILGHAEVRAIVTCDALLDTAIAVRDALASAPVVVSAGRDTRPGVVPFEDVRDDDASEFQVPVGEDDLADIMYTSGTTGLPKGVAVRHRNVAMIPNCEPVWSAAGWLHGAPLFTFAGISFIFNPMKMGLVGMYLPRFDAGRWLEIVERDRPMMAFLVPAMAELLVAHPDFAARDLSSLVAVSVGSAPLAPATLLAMQERLPNASVSNSYGMTEAGPAFIVMPKEEVTRRIGSVGKPLPPMELKIVDEDDREVATGSVGELLTRLPGRQREYYKDDDATSATWTADGWLRSGDLAYVDEDGFLYIVGRKKDVIIRGGNNVYATDVEAVVLEHPDVREVAVIGVPHTVLGEDVAAYVVLRDGATCEPDDVKEFCASRLADYKRPRHVSVVDELPRNATGKVMKHVLRASVESAPA
ncbi:MAG TPA: class I adenylate-forming enzyme family protein [Acidimicrobiia bacterium]|nr:class I adenylate-forming enzyme family protein [Acidimicrobiia bacterium]